jgi:hypothetical protein
MQEYFDELWSRHHTMSRFWIFILQFVESWGSNMACGESNEHRPPSCLWGWSVYRGWTLLGSWALREADRTRRGNCPLASRPTPICAPKRSAVPHFYPIAVSCFSFFKSQEMGQNLTDSWHSLSSQSTYFFFCFWFFFNIKKKSTL